MDTRSFVKALCRLEDRAESRWERSFAADLNSGGAPHFWQKEEHEQKRLNRIRAGVDRALTTWGNA